jgi:hypothetical protein
MGWLEDRAHDHAESAMERAYGVVGPGYGWAGGKFGRLLTTGIRWAGAGLAIFVLVLWVKNGVDWRKLVFGSTANHVQAEKPKGGF